MNGKQTNHNKPMNYTLLSKDETLAESGEGITMTTAPGSRLWPYRVVFPGNRPMNGSIRAASKRQAEQFLRARHPQALGVTVEARG